ncbi:hypothetical protein FRC02_000689 [Tulasnella sp. 418]|nr:hypothetical protein FRC02_000689 [Tulasnella sp. 418]
MATSAGVSTIVKCADSAVPEVQPHLMPFHITYTGPAAISTYFMIRDAPKEEEDEVTPVPKNETVEETQVTPDESQNSSGSTLVEESATPALEEGTSKEASSVSMNAVVVDIVNRFQKRLVSAFRGRQIHGIEVELPKGYGGVVLRVEGNDDTKIKVGDKRKRDDDDSMASKAKKKVKGIIKNAGRLTRKRSKTVTEVDEDEEMGDANEEEVQADSMGVENVTTKTFAPTATFSKLVIWNADRRVDEGRDEYTRALREWPRMADLIHSC